MAINGICSLVYGVDNIQECARFFADFGLPPASVTDDEALFSLADGAEVRLLPLGDARLPRSRMVGTGVHEIVFGVDDAEAMQALLAGLQSDREVRVDADGTAHFLDDNGLAMALRVFTKKPIVSAPDPVNAPGRIQRLNTHRRWRRRAQPKTIQHAVFAVPDVRASFAFLRDRLGFRLSDYQEGVGVYARADGSHSHHTLFLMDAHAPFPGMDGQLRFHHANFGVEDLDELMVGANYMERQGWPRSQLGLGRHRIDSALFLYLPCPAGGEAEYGADGDAIDDAWVPRHWPVPLFGVAHYVHNLPDWLREEPAWDVRYLTDGALPPDLHPTSADHDARA